MSEGVRLERQDAIAIVVLDRPEVLNAVNAGLREALIEMLADLNRAEDVRAIILTGAGDRAFCSGQDIEEIADFTPADVDSWVIRQHAMYAAVRDLDKPCVAAFNGVAAGAGFQLALCADLRVGYPEMKIGQPEIRAGLASIVGSWMMTSHLGQSRNAELSLSGELISGQRAYEWGLLNQLVPGTQVMEKSLALANAMANLAPTAFRLSKQHLRALSQAGFEAALTSAKAAQKEAFASGEPQRAMRKFLEGKRAGSGRKS